MKYGKFGHSELTTSRLGLGLAALGRPGYINLGHQEDYGDGKTIADMQNRAFAVLDAAWKAGIRYFDTARSYGKGEAFLGAWLQDRGIQTDAVLIGSKWGYTYTADWKVEADFHEVKEHSLERLAQQYPESRELLGDYLKIYHIHSATRESGVLENGEVIKRLGALKASGLLIGLSLSGPAQADTLGRALEIFVDGQLLFDSVQITWNLLESSSTARMVEAKSAGLGVIVKEALANGRLTDRNQAPTFQEKKKRLESLAATYEMGLDALALAVVLEQDFVDIVLSGAAQVNHLEANLKSTEVAKIAEAEALMEVLRENPEQYWKTRKSLEWN